MIDIRRDYAWLALAGYLGLAIAVPALMLAPARDDIVPPIAPLTFVDTPADESMMAPLYMQAGAALNQLQASRQATGAL